MPPESARSATWPSRPTARQTRPTSSTTLLVRWTISLKAQQTGASTSSPPLVGSRTEKSPFAHRPQSIGQVLELSLEVARCRDPPPLAVGAGPRVSPGWRPAPVGLVVLLGGRRPSALISLAIFAVDLVCVHGSLQTVGRIADRTLKRG